MTNNIQNKKRIPAQFFVILIAFLENEYKFDSKSFLKKKDISYSQLFQKDFSLDISILKELIVHMLEKEKDYSFLYKLSQLSTPSRLGILGYIMIHSKDVYEALEKLCKYYLLIGNRLNLVFAKEDEFYKIVLYFNDEEGSFMDIEEYNVLIHLFAILHLINHIIPLDIKPSKITLTQDKPSFSLKNSEIVGIKTYFAKEENAIYFHKNIKDIQTISANEQLLKMFEKEAEETLQLKLSQSALKEKISSLIIVSSTQLDISLDSIALKAGLSPRVLQKRLKEEGTSFIKILKEVRKKLSIYYLSRNMDLATISLNLGYIDLSSFFRAFKKWYGVTPSQYKEQKEQKT